MAVILHTASSLVLLLAGATHQRCCAHPWKHAHVHDISQLVVEVLVLLMISARFIGKAMRTPDVYLNMVCALAATKAPPPACAPLLGASFCRHRFTGPRPAIRVEQI